MKFIKLTLDGNNAAVYLNATNIASVIESLRGATRIDLIHAATGHAGHHYVKESAATVAHLVEEHTFTHE